MSAPLEVLQADPDVDLSDADMVVAKTADAGPITLGQVVEAQARLLDLVLQRAKAWERSNNPGRKAAGVELRDLLRR